jgi:hypothetical protein
MYGFTTDELVDHLKATRIFEFIASGGSEREQILKIDLINIYGALPDMLALALEKLIPALSFDSRHLVSALFGLAGIYYAYRVGSVFVSPSVGFMTVLLLTFNPMWFGYMFINAKDIPFATTLLAAFYYSLCALTGRDESQWCWARVGLAAGLLASTKLIGVLVLGLIGFLALAALVAVPTSSRLRIDPVFFYRLLMTAISALVGSLICFAVFWPQFFLWSPAQIFGVVRLFMNFDQWRGYVQIHGSYFSAAMVPWYYLSTYFAISMPLFLLPLTAAGAIGGVLNREPLIISSLIACVLFFTYQAVTGARVALNGYRHFLFLLPFVTLVAAYPIGRLLESRLFIVRVAALAVAAAGSVTAAVSMYQLFPYQYSFYNKLVGGIQGADGKYEIDVWRSALREALRKFSVMADTNDVVRIYTCGSALNFKEHPLFRLVESEKREDADYIVALRRVCDAEYFQIQDLPAIGEVRRQGVLFAAIYSRPTGGWPHVKPRLQ